MVSYRWVGIRKTDQTDFTATGVDTGRFYFGSLARIRANHMLYLSHPVGSVSTRWHLQLLIAPMYLHIFSGWRLIEAKRPPPTVRPTPCLQTLRDHTPSHLSLIGQNTLGRYLPMTLSNTRD